MNDGVLASLKKVMVDTKHLRHPHLVTPCKKLGIEIAGSRVCMLVCEVLCKRQK